jgi:hypothetical protein
MKEERKRGWDEEQNSSLSKRSYSVLEFTRILQII